MNVKRSENPNEVFLKICKDELLNLLEEKTYELDNGDSLKYI